MIDNQDLYNLRTLRVYLYYRLILSSLLFSMYEAELTVNTLGINNPDLFRWATLCYAIISLFSLLLLRDKTAYRSSVKVGALLITDMIALIILINASGGVSSGLGYLLVITAAIASMFLSAQFAMGFAAFISLSLIAETIYFNHPGDTVKSLFGAGTLGFLVFVTTVAFRYLTERITASTKEAAEKSQYAKQVVQLAHHIVERMRTGIVVFDDDNEIDLINESAIQLLDLAKHRNYIGNDIYSLSNLGEIIDAWRKNPQTGLAKVHKINAGRQIRINFASLNAIDRQVTILYLEDYRSLVQQAQQLKLASLGRLTASIAHEIRNPLGAISHAAQLLSESEKVDPSDLRFTEIILQHSQRVNEIIENTTSLSKRKEPHAELIELAEWIPGFIEEYSTAKTCDIRYEWDEGQPKIKMDASHLRQILTNLFDNGLRFSMEYTNNASIIVKSGISVNDDTTYIDVIDFGPGVQEEKVQEIFEPFFTTGEQGTGLGLYISRELCEINQATLNYLRTPDKQSCFKINFPHHQRII